MNPGEAQNTPGAVDHFNWCTKKHAMTEGLPHNARTKSSPSTERPNFCSSTPSSTLDSEILLRTTKNNSTDLSSFNSSMSLGTKTILEQPVSYVNVT